MNLGQFKNKWVWIVLGSLISIQIVIHQLEGQKNQNTSSQQSIDSVDTYVPIGFQLIPIRISNQEEVGSLIDDFALVDLFETGKPNPILRSTRLIRSPRNPDVFAVLVEQDSAALVLDEDRSFYVAIRNPKQMAMRSKNKPRRLILEQ